MKAHTDRNGYCSCADGGYHLEKKDHSKGEELSNMRCKIEKFGPEKCKAKDHMFPLRTEKKDEGENWECHKDWTKKRY